MVDKCFAKFTLGLVGIANHSSITLGYATLFAWSDGIARYWVPFYAAECLAIVFAALHQRAWSLRSHLGAGMLFSGGLLRHG